MLKATVLLVVGLLLSGCETFYANLIQDYNDGRNAIRGYIGENFQDRVSVREQCRNLLAIQVNALMTEGKYEEAQQLLIERYPPVITVKMVRNEEVGPEEVNHPHICGKPSD